MPDAPPTPPTPTEPNKKRQRGPLNKAQMAELTKAEQVGKAAQKGDRPPALAEREITGAFVEQLLTDVAEARNISANALQSTTSKTTASVDEDAAEGDLIVALQEVQAAARQKYARSQPEKLRDYYVGQKLGAKRSLLEQYSQAIIERLSTDTLPGITATKVTNLGTLRAAYIAGEDTQGGAQSDATTGRVTLEQKVESIKDRRMQIQFAADGEWPYTTKANAGIRKEFQLPPSRPFSG